jgi:ribosome maturation factor RimP
MRVSAAGPGSAAFLLLGAGALRATNPVEERIVALAEPTAQELGYRLVRVRVSGNRRKRLQIMAERVSDGDMGIDDCTKLSRALSALFDVQDPMPDEYDLEVSSPGIDRPLMRIEDFQRFLGHEAKLETMAMIDGRRRFKGVISAVKGDTVQLKLPDSEIEVALPFSSLSDARLVLTDRLIAEDLKRSKAALSSPVSGGSVASEASDDGGGVAPSASPLRGLTAPPQAGEQNEKKRKHT